MEQEGEPVRQVVSENPPTNSLRFLVVGDTGGELLLPLGSEVELWPFKVVYVAGCCKSDCQRGSLSLKCHNSAHKWYG